MNRILVTGGAGFIGSHFVRKALKKKYEVGIFDNFSSGFKKNIPKGCKIYTADIRDSKEVAHIFKDFSPKFVVHLAAMVSVPESLINPQKCEDNNIAGLKNILQESEKYDIHGVFASSAAVYGKAFPPLEEKNAELNLKYIAKLPSPYAQSKLRGEILCNESKISFCNFRFFNVFGERQSLSGGYPAVIPAFLSGVFKNNQIEIFGDGEQTRDFIYAGDIATAMLESIEKKLSGTYNLGSGLRLTINEVALLLKQKVDKKFKIIYQPERIGDIRHSYCKTDHYLNNFSFRFRTRLQDKIDDLINEYSNDLYLE